MTHRLWATYFLLAWLECYRSVAWVTGPFTCFRTHQNRDPASVIKPFENFPFAVPSASSRTYSARAAGFDNAEAYDISLPHTVAVTTRRDWLSNVAIASGAAVASTTSTPQQAYAAEKPVSVSICDPSVSTWRKQERTIHLVGTAHISTSSAALAGQVIRDVRPSAVFVELDRKRLPIQALSLNAFVAQVNSLSVPLKSDKATLPLAPYALSEAAFLLTIPNPFPFDLMWDPLGAAVGNSIKALYRQLDKAGYKPGDEFVVAIREGLRIGSTIVMGDQDVELTTRRLARALSVTDMKKLFEPDSQLEQSMKEIFPGVAEPPKLSDLKDETARNELTAYVETLKAKENVRRIMEQLKRIAPEMYHVMVTERDAYMSNGLNYLDQFPTIVAVMGIAHVDGVEQNLRSLGWNQVRYRCPRRK